MYLHNFYLQKKKTAPSWTYNVNFGKSALQFDSFVKNLVQLYTDPICGDKSLNITLQSSKNKQRYSRALLDDFQWSERPL